MKWLKAHWKPLAVVLALVLWAAWYSRPVDVYALSPGLEKIDSIHIYASPLDPKGAHDFPVQKFTQEDPEWSAVKEPIEALRFRRPPWNLLLQFIPQNTYRAETVHEGDYHVMFLVAQKDKGNTQVQFFVDRWTYSTSLPLPFSNRNLTLWVKDSREAGETLAERLRPLLKEEAS